MLKDVDLGLLQASYSDDPACRSAWQDVQKDANECLNRPPLVYRSSKGPGCSASVGTACGGSTPWRWPTGGRARREYAAKAKENLLEVCAFKDWNPSHFLDTAEMSHAVGVGYDWLYELPRSADSRATSAPP